MSYAMIWVEALAAMLLLLATITACVARWRRRWARVVVLLAVILPLMALAVSGWFVTLVFKYSYAMENPWFGYALSWTIVFSAGAVVLFFCGRGRAGQEPRAYSWPRGRLALAFVAAFALLYITVSNLDLAMKMQQASLRAEAGAKVLALTPPRVPDTENAALVYVEALGAMTPHDQTPSEAKKVLSAPFAEQNRLLAKDPKVLAYLASQEHALALLRKAAAMPKCSFDQEAYYELSSGSGFYDVKLVSQLKLFYAAHLLVADAFVRSSSDDTRAALDDLVAVFGLARHARQANVPTINALLVAVAIEKIATHALEEILLRHDLTPEQLERLPLGDPSSHRRDMVRALYMDEASNLALFALLCSDGPTADLVFYDATSLRTNEPENDTRIVPPGALALWRIYLMPNELAADRRRMTRLRQLVERPYYEAYADWQTFDDDPQRRRREVILTGFLIYSSQFFVGSVFESDALAGLTRLAVAAKLYKAKNGKYPKSMEDLTPAFLPQPLLDPFDGKPLRMHPDGAGLILYSIGADMRDNGGTPWDKTKHEGDIVFRLK